MGGEDDLRLGVPAASALPACAPHVGCGAEAGPGRRFSARRKLAAVQRLLRGESLEALSRELNVPAHRLSEWRERALLGAEDARSEKTERLQARVGEITGARAALREDRQAGGRPPFGWAEVEAMTRATSPSRQRAQGIRTAPRRVRRLMKEHGLLAPHRPAPRATCPYDGAIVTARVDEVWGTDMTREGVTAAEGRGVIHLGLWNRVRRRSGRSSCRSGKSRGEPSCRGARSRRI